MRSVLERGRLDRLADYEQFLPVVIARVEQVATTVDDEHPVVEYASRLNELLKQMHVIVPMQRILRSLAFEEIHNRRDTVAEAHRNTFSWIYKDGGHGFADWATGRNGTSMVTWAHYVSLND